MILLVLEVSKLGPCFPFHILGKILLLTFLLEPIPSGDGIRSALDVITPMMPPSKGYVFKGEGSGACLLGFILDAYRSEVCLKSLKEVIDLPCIPCFIIDWRSESITL